MAFLAPASFPKVRPSPLTEMVRCFYFALGFVAVFVIIHSRQTGGWRWAQSSPGRAWLPLQAAAPAGFGDAQLLSTLAMTHHDPDLFVDHQISKMSKHSSIKLAGTANRKGCFLA